MWYSKVNEAVTNKKRRLGYKLDPRISVVDSDPI